MIEVEREGNTDFHDWSRLTLFFLATKKLSNTGAQRGFLRATFVSCVFVAKTSIIRVYHDQS